MAIRAFVVTDAQAPRASRAAFVAWHHMLRRWRRYAAYLVIGSVLSWGRQDITLAALIPLAVIGDGFLHFRQIVEDIRRQMPVGTTIALGFGDEAFAVPDLVFDLARRRMPPCRRSWSPMDAPSSSPRRRGRSGLCRRSRCRRRRSSDVPKFECEEADTPLLALTLATAYSPPLRGCPPRRNLAGTGARPLGARKT